LNRNKPLETKGLATFGAGSNGLNGSELIIFNVLRSVNLQRPRRVNQSFTIMGHHHFTARSQLSRAVNDAERRRCGEVIANTSKGL
jgi:hypothetical protein